MMSITFVSTIMVSPHCEIPFWRERVSVDLDHERGPWRPESRSSACLPRDQFEYRGRVQCRGHRHMLMISVILLTRVSASDQFQQRLYGQDDASFVAVLMKAWSLALYSHPITIGFSRE